MKGSGSVRLRGKTWSYRVGLGKMKIDGKRKQIEGSGFRTQKEAVKAMQEILAQYHKTGEYVDNKKITFQQNYDEFIRVEASATRAYATILRYESIYRNHLQNEFGPLYLYQIDSKRIQTFLHEKSSKYSESFVKSLYKAFNVLFSYAYRNKVIKVNPMDDVAPPPDPRHRSDVVIYSAQEREKIQERIESTNVKSAYYIGLNTGVRVSECFALRWSDIDFEKRTVRIDKQLRFQDKKWCFTPLKTRNSYRTIDVSAPFVQYLTKLKKAQEAAALVYGTSYQKTNVVWDRRLRHQDDPLEIDDFINIKQNGKMMTSDSEKFMAKIIKQDCDIYFKFHNLRHTYATLLAESGVSPRYAQEQLGHAKMEFTLRYYTHLTESMKNTAMNLLSAKISLPHGDTDEEADTE